MAESFSMKLSVVAASATSDATGEWQYVGANAVTDSGIAATLLATKRVMNPAPNFAPNASMLTVNIQFPYAENSAVAPHMTLQGTHDLVSNDENGTVTAVSPELAEFLGGSFAFDSTALVLTVTAPAPADTRKQHVSHGVLSVAATEPVRIV